MQLKRSKQEERACNVEVRNPANIYFLKLNFEHVIAGSILTHFICRFQGVIELKRSCEMG